MFHKRLKKHFCLGGCYDLVRCLEMCFTDFAGENCSFGVYVNKSVSTDTTVSLHVEKAKVMSGEPRKTHEFFISGEEHVSETF